MADKIAVLRLGELEQFGAPLELFNRPNNLFVVGFIGSPKMNFIQGDVDTSDRQLLVLGTGEKVSLPGNGYLQKTGQAVTLGVRPNDLRPDDEGSLTLEVRSVEQLGTESYIYGNLLDETVITIHSPGQTRVTRGEKIKLSATDGMVHLFDADSGLTL